MRALGLAFLTTLLGCILVVSPEEYGTTCRFKGENTQCGTCIASKCNAEVHECCRDASCEETLANLDGCAELPSEACNALMSTARSISQCVKRECAAVCPDRFPAGVSTTKCREPRLGEGSACTCEANGETNDFLCNPQAFRESLCCAPKGWPAPGLACTCRPLNCNATNDGCFCSLGDFTPKQRECTAVKCCVDKDKCACRARDCFAFEREVESCSVDVLDCADGQDKVESCSARTSP